MARIRVIDDYGMDVKGAAHRNNNFGHSGLLQHTYRILRLTSRPDPLQSIQTDLPSSPVGQIHIPAADVSLPILVSTNPNGSFSAISMDRRQEPETAGINRRGATQSSYRHVASCPLTVLSTVLRHAFAMITAISLAREALFLNMLGPFSCCRSGGARARSSARGQAYRGTRGRIGP